MSSNQGMCCEFAESQATLDVTADISENDMVHAWGRTLAAQFAAHMDQWQILCSEMHNGGIKCTTTA